MRKISSILLLILTFSLAIFCFTGCGTPPEDEEPGSSFNPDEVTLLSVYEQAKDLGFKGTLEEFIELISGKDGKDGKDGVSPTIDISSDGYWVINGVKTAHKAVPKDGEDGAPGTPGAPGQNGTTPTIDISSDGYWVINGVKTAHKAVCDCSPVVKPTTEAEWKSAFDFDNVTLNLIQSSDNSIAPNGPVILVPTTNTIYRIVGNDLYLLMDDEWLQDNYTEYFKMYFDFSDYYANFIFEDGVYKSKSLTVDLTLAMTGGVVIDGYSQSGTNIVIKFDEDGKLVSVEYDITTTYELDDGYVWTYSMHEIYEFSNHGTTVAPSANEMHTVCFDFYGDGHCLYCGEVMPEESEGAELLTEDEWISAFEVINATVLVTTFDYDDRFDRYDIYDNVKYCFTNEKIYANRDNYWEEVNANDYSGLLLPLCFSDYYGSFKYVEQDNAYVADKITLKIYNGDIQMEIDITDITIVFDTFKNVKYISVTSEAEKKAILYKFSKHGTTVGPAEDELHTVCTDSDSDGYCDKCGEKLSSTETSDIPISEEEWKELFRLDNASFVLTQSYNDGTGRPDRTQILEFRMVDGNMYCCVDGEWVELTSRNECEFFLAMFDFSEHYDEFTYANGVYSAEKIDYDPDSAEWFEGTNRYATNIILSLDEDGKLNTIEFDAVDITYEDITSQSYKFFNHGTTEAPI